MLLHIPRESLSVAVNRSQSSPTAVNVTSIGEITTDETFRIISGGKIGQYTKRIGEILSGIRNETIEDQFEWLFPVF